MNSAKRLLLSLVCLIWISGIHSSSLQSPNDSSVDIMDAIFRNGYDKRIRPNFQGKPVEVTISANLRDVYDINDLSHQFTVRLVFRQAWVDPRLAFQPPAGVDYISLDPAAMKKIWAPDTFFTNERKALVHSFSTTNEYYRVKPDGLVLHSQRVTVTASCIMNLKWFPFDRHTCTLNMESYGYNGKGINYTISTDKLVVSKETRTSIQYTIQAIKTNAVNLLGYSRASIEFFVKRNPLRYIQDIFFIAIILPIVSFATLCTGSLQSRVHLSVIILTAMVIFQTLTSSAMPKVSYQTALDFYVFISMLIIFIVVMVNFLMYHFLKPKNAQDDKMPRVNGNADDDSAANIPSYFKMRSPLFSERLIKIFVYSMPIFFVTFNIFYWPIVLIGSNTFPEDFILLENHSI